MASRRREKSHCGGLDLGLGLDNFDHKASLQILSMLEVSFSLQFSCNYRHEWVKRMRAQEKDLKRGWLEEPCPEGAC